MARWDPFRELSRLEREIGRMFDELWSGRPWARRALPGGERPTVPAERAEELIGAPPTDLIDKKNELIVRAEIPGVKKENIKVNVTEDEVSIAGRVERGREEKEENYYRCERSYGAWQRTLSLPVRVRPDQVKAKYKDGVLEITLPKTEEEKEKRREIKIE